MQRNRHLETSEKFFVTLKKTSVLACNCVTSLGFIYTDYPIQGFSSEEMVSPLKRGKS
jgi:hypothetical protein